MKYQKLETYAAIMTGIAAAVVGDLVLLAIGYEPFGVVCFASWCFWVLGTWLFLTVNDGLYTLRRKKDISADQRRTKQVNFIVGRQVKGAPDYVEVRNERTAV